MKQNITKARKAAENKLAALKAEAQTKIMEKAISLLESPQPVPVPWQEYPQYDTWGMPRVGGFEVPYIWTNPDDATEGRYRPYYENAHDVRRMMAEWRCLAKLPVAQTALRKLSDYISCNGWDCTVQPKDAYKDDPTAIQLAKLVQAAVDKILDHNKFIGGMDRTIHEKSRIDGNVYPTLYPEGDCVRIELTDPGCILEPANKQPLERMCRTHGKLNGWWHGVHTVWNPLLKRDDVARPLGYHAVYDRIGDQWAYLPSWRVQHIKRNVDENLARVGVGDFFFVVGELNAEAKIRRNTGEGAAALAAIIMIREHAEGVTQSTIESMVQNSSTTDYERSVKDGTRTTYRQQLAPATVKDVPAGMKHSLGPMGTLNQPTYILVAQYVLRVLGNLWSMPEFMISGDASNNNYASILVAESPFVKYCEHEQNIYGGHAVEILWKGLRMLRGVSAPLAAYPWHVVRALIEINPVCTSPASRNMKELADTNAVLHDKGILSKRTWATDSGLDYDEEQKNMQTEPKPAPAPVLGPDGLPMKPAFGGFGGPSTESLALRAMDLLLEQAHKTNE